MASDDVLTLWCLRCGAYAVVLTLMPSRDQGEVAPLETPVIQPVEVPAASHDAVSTEAVAVSTEAAAVAAEAALVEEEVTPAAASAAPTAADADADGDKDDEAGEASVPVVPGTLSQSRTVAAAHTVPGSGVFTERVCTSRQLNDCCCAFRWRHIRCSITRSLRPCCGMRSGERKASTGGGGGKKGKKKGGRGRK